MRETISTFQHAVMARRPFSPGLGQKCFLRGSKNYTRVQPGFRRVETWIAQIGLCTGAVFLLAAPDHIQSANRWWIIKYAVHISCVRAGPERRTRRGVACIGCADIGIHQRACWLMHMPLACAIMIRSPLSKTKKPPNGDFLFWWTRRMTVCISFSLAGDGKKK